MYGMIHKAARAYALEKHGEPLWNGIVERCGLTDSDFVLAKTYDDEATFRIIRSIAESEGTEPQAFLRLFGRHWINFARNGSYAHLMKLGGSNLGGFISNLNRMHAGLALAMPGSRMPLFYVTEDTKELLRLSYVSERQGLEQLVLGLLEGLCEMFAVDAEVAHLREAGDGVFEIRYRHPN